MIIVVYLIGLIVGSCFGIFFSGEDSGTGQTMRQAVQEINCLLYTSQVWSYVGELIFNMLVLVGAVKMADRVVREMMGL